ncbi:MAG: response regulator [Alphaproteobacteria bacterium]|jgi:CheY-like chemotaxis protein|nr:response regulator [Alphaproteobacteria bacterium]
MARILLAEDDESVRRFVARALTLDGHDVTEAADGALALEALREDRFDLLLTDIAMPVMDGIQLALNVARDYPTLRILMMSGYADERRRAHNLETLVHDVVAKPFSLAEIVQAVAKALEG